MEWTRKNSVLALAKERKKKKGRKKHLTRRTKENSKYTYERCIFERCARNLLRILVRANAFERRDNG